MNHANVISSSLFLASILAFPSIATADDKTITAPYIPDKKEILAAKKKDDGWKPALRFGASLSLGSNSNVVGQSDGYTMAGNFQIDGGLDFFRGPHEWRNTLKITEAFAHTPTVGEFVKSNDVFDFNTIYLYHLKRYPWIGPYAKFSLSTALFPGYDIRGAETTYRITNVDGNTFNSTADRLHLSRALSPMTLKETAGAFAQPIDKDHLKLEVKLGFGARHTFADGQYAINDDAATDGIIEVKELQSVHQGGPVLDLGMRGDLKEKLIIYSLGAEAMVPVISSREDPDGRGSMELINLLFEAGLTFKLASWISIDYTFKALREPQVVDKFQIQNNLLLTFGWAFWDSAKKS